MESGTSARIVACVVTYNRFDKFTKAVARLLDEPIDAVVVVDNGSTDGTREWLRTAADERVTVIESDRNLGGAGGFELAMRHAMAEHRPDWLLLQDDDAWPEPGAVTTFRELEIGDDVGSVCAAVYTQDGTICEINRPGLNPFHGLRPVIAAVLRGRSALHVTDQAFAEDSVDIDCASFVGVFVRASLIDRGLGYPPGEFFIYSDDQVYSYRIRQLGFRNLMVPRIEYCHDTVSKSDAGYFSPMWKVYFLYRNNIELYRRMAGRWFWLVMCLKLPAWVLRARLYPDPRRYLHVASIGVRDGLRRRFDRELADVQSLSEPRPPR